MRTFLGFSANAALFLTVASLFVIGGVILALLLFFPLFVLALVAILISLDDRIVQQHNPSMDATQWRRRSQMVGHERDSIGRGRDRRAPTAGIGTAPPYAAGASTRRREVA
jgi:hypothetical protein